MAGYNEILAGRFNRGLQKLFGMKGPASVNTLSSDVQTVHPFTSGVENRLAEGWFSYADASPSLAGVGGQFRNIRYRNPRNSGVMAVIEKFQISHNVAPPVGFDVFFDIAVANQADLGATSGIGPALDNRASVQSPTLIKSSISQVASTNSGTQIWRWFISNANTSVTSPDAIVTVDQEIPLAPGSFINFQSDVVAVAFTVNFWWRERALEESERTF